MTENIFEKIQESGTAEYAASYSAEGKLSQVLLKAIETTTEMVIVTNAPDKIGDEEILFVNKAFEKVTQYSKEEVLGKAPSFLQGPKTNDKVIKKLVKRLSEGKHFEGETFNYKKDGTTYRVRWSIDPIRDKEGEITHFVSVQNDITKEWKQRQKLQEIIDEREMLIKETHHRIKNNLATITGLLELQIMRSDSEEVRDVLSESMNRVQSIASIHEKLYKTEGLASISLDVYISDLIEQLHDSIESIGNSQSSEINFELDLEPVSLNMRQAVPLGLILNELVSNAHKHAFDDNPGTVSVTCYEEEEKVHLEVKDNGKGIPESLDIHSTKSLGLKLIDTLSQQLNARYTLIPENGTRFKMSFKKDK